MKNRFALFRTFTGNFLAGRVPGQLVIQLTDKCNARCPQCGMRVTEEFQRTKLGLDEVKKMIDAAAAQGIEAISFTGGEPLLFLDEVAELCHYAGKAGIRFIRTGTNGFLFTGSNRPGFREKISRIAESLARTPLRNFWISIDSADPDTHEQMRGFPGVIEGIAKALPIFHEHGIYPSANLGINRNTGGIQEGKDKLSLDNFLQKYRGDFARFYQFVIELGFTIVNCCYPMSVDPGKYNGSLQPVYAATATDTVVSFTRQEKALLYQALLETIPSFRHRIRIFTPLVSLYTLHQHYTDESAKPTACRGGLDFFFIDSRNGDTFPCGYRGCENLGKIWNLQHKNYKPQVENCLLCDWECFRDPSELFGPFLEGRKNPLRLLQRIRRDKKKFQHWCQDLTYYRACDFFDGRRLPRIERLAKFKQEKKNQQKDILILPSGQIPSSENIITAHGNIQEVSSV